MPAGLRGDHRLLNTRQKLLRLGQRQPQMRDIAKVAGRPDLHDAIPGPGLSVSVSTNRKTHPIRDLPAGNGPTGHIACVLIPSLSGHSLAGRRCPPACPHGWARRAGGPVLVVTLAARLTLTLSNADRPLIPVGEMPA